MLTSHNVSRPKAGSAATLQLAILIMVLLITALWGLAMGTDAYGQPPQEPAQTQIVDVNQALIDRYTAVWHEPDSTRRLQTLANIWAPTGEHLTPQSHSVGPQAMNEEIAAFQARFPGATVETSKLMRTGLHLVFEFNLRNTRGEIIVAGVDYMRLDDSGKITEVVGFF